MEMEKAFFFFTFLQGEVLKPAEETHLCLRILSCHLISLGQFKGTAPNITMHFCVLNKKGFLDLCEFLASMDIFVNEFWEGLEIVATLMFFA